MNTSNFLTQLQTQAQGVLFMSESEYPFEPQNLGVLEAAAIPAAVATHSGTANATVKTIAPEQFMAQLERSADPGDAPIVANLQK